MSVQHEKIATNDVPQSPPSHPSSSYCSCRKVKLKVILRIIGSLVVPFFLAIFTVVITFTQRDEARIQRQQDLLLSREQRLQDDESARLQRMQELNISIEQRELERELAAKTRTLNHEQRLHELEIQSENQQDALFGSYLTEIGSLLLHETNDSLLSANPKIAVLVQAKTLHVIRQINVARKQQLIKFLYNSGQLYVNRNPINLYGADLNNIDLQGQPILQNISLAGTYLNNASFIGQDLRYADFSNAHINGSNFAGTNCVQADFRNAYLYKANFREAKVLDTNFDDAYLVNADFSYSNLSGSSFIRTNLVRALVNGILVENRMTFVKTNLAGIDFTRALFSNDLLTRTLFVDVNLVDSSFKGIKLQNVYFHYCNMTRVDFSFSILNRIEFKGSILVNVTFMNAWLETVFLSYANVTNSNFHNVHCAMHGCMWEKALVLQNTTMPNGTISNSFPKSFLVNGHADCNRSINIGWTKFSSSDAISVVRHNNDSVCRFVQVKHSSDVLSSFFSSHTMSQDIELPHFYSELRKEGRALARVRFRCHHDVTILLKEFDYPFRNYQCTHTLRPHAPLPKDWFYVAEIPLDRLTTNLDFTIQFPAYDQGKDLWCEFVELDITSLTHAPY